MARKLLTMVAAAALTFGTTAAQAAASLSVARAYAPLAGASYLQDDDDDDDSTPVIIGLVLVVLLIAIAVGGNRGEPSNSP